MADQSLHLYNSFNNSLSGTQESIFSQASTSLHCVPATPILNDHGALNHSAASEQRVPDVLVLDVHESDSYPVPRHDVSQVSRNENGEELTAIDESHLASQIRTYCPPVQLNSSLVSKNMNENANKSSPSRKMLVTRRHNFWKTEEKCSTHNESTLGTCPLLSLKREKLLRQRRDFWKA